MRVADLGRDGIALLGERERPGTARRCGSRSPPRASSASPAEPCAPGRRRAPRRSAAAPRAGRSGASRTATARRRSAAHRRGSLEQRVERRRAGSRRRGRAAASRAAASASASAQRACRSASAVRLARLVEPLARVQANGLEQAVAALAGGALVRGDERLLDEAREHVGDAASVELAAGAHASRPPRARSRRRRPRAAETASARPASSRSWLHWSVAVSVCCRVGDAWLALREHAEAIVEPLRDRRRTERSQAPGGELERERQAVEAKADTGNVDRVLLVEREARRRRVRPLDEQPHGLVAQELAAARACCSGSGMSSDGTRNTTSPGTRSGSRLVARIVSWARERSSVSASPAVAASRCSQLSSDEQQRARREELDHRVDELLPGQRSHVERGRDGVRDEPRRRRARRARRAPRRPGTTASAARASSSASRVLPTPPVPARVSRRVPRSSAFSSASSRSRPTNELASTGSGRQPGGLGGAEGGAHPRAPRPAPPAPHAGPSPSRRSDSRAAARRRTARAPRGTQRVFPRGARRQRPARAGRRRHPRPAGAAPPVPRSRSASSARRATYTA